MTEVTRGVQQVRAQQARPDGAVWQSFGISLIFGVLLTLVIMAAWIFTLPEAQRTGMLAYWSSVQAPALSFNPGPLLKAPLSVQLHVAAAVVALFVGAVIFLLPKGTGFHKLLGWTWVSSMIIVAATSIAMIVDLRTGINAACVYRDHGHIPLGRLDGYPPGGRQAACRVDDRPLCGRVNHCRCLRVHTGTRHVGHFLRRLGSLGRRARRRAPPPAGKCGFHFGLKGFRKPAC